MKKNLTIVLVCVAVVVGLCAFGPSLFAQGYVMAGKTVAIVPDAQAPTAKPDTVALTAEQESTLENKVIKMELMARELSPEALGKAIADLIAAKQQAYQTVTQDLNAYTQTLAMDGTELQRDPKTGKFARVKKDK